MRNRPCPGPAGLVLAGMLLAGCTSYSADPSPDFIFDQSVVRIEKDGVVVGADPWFDEKSMIAGFGLDLSKGRYYPVRLRITNLSDERIVIARDEIVLTDGSGADHAAVASEDVAEDLRHNSVAYGMLGFGILSFRSAEKANARMRRDWAAKELPPSILLGAGDARTGFAFFQLPAEVSPTSTTIRIHARGLIGPRDTVLSGRFKK